MHGRILPTSPLVVALLILNGVSALSASDPATDVSRIGQYLDRWHEAGRFNGAALVAKDGEVLLKRGYGLANREWNIRNAPDTKFHIGSIAKQFTTVLVFQLAAEERLRLDDKLSEHLPEYRRDIGDRVTIDQLLQHTSGIPCYVRDSKPRPDGTGDFEFAGHYDRPELISEFMSADLLFEPGSQYHYSSTGHYLLACILEKLTGRSYEEILRERILGPLGLKDTAVETPGGLLPKRAGGYVKVPGGYANAPNEYAPNLLGTGNLFSTVEDLYAWNCALRSGRLLPDEWQRKMLTVYWPDAFGSHAYVLNHYVRRTRSGESLRYTGFSGALPGFASDAFHFTDEDLTVVLLDNTSQYNQWAIAPEIHAIVTGAAVDMPRPPASDVLAREAVAKDIPAAVKLHQKMHKESAGDFDFGGLERELNTLGYNALAARMLDRAITVFKLNTELFPDSWNVYDSLGEAYGEAGETALSAQYYAKAETIKHREDRLLELVRAGEYDAVVKELRELRLREPNVQVFTSARIGPLFGRAFEKGDNEQALAIARVWALGNPKALGPYFSQSRVFERLAKPSDAALCYQRILELAPEGPHVERVRQALARLETAGSD